jgi:hypothetical protein
MATYLERYQSGEYEQVWTELVALGGQVREPSVLPHAQAVANETMRRARINIELIIERLKKIDYDFVYPNAIYHPPTKDVVTRLNKFERKIGPIPLSLRAWCEIVGDVNLMGNYPKLSYYHNSGLGSIVGKAFGQGRLELGDIQTLMGKMQMPPNAPKLDDTQLGRLQDSLNAILGRTQSPTGNPLLDSLFGGMKEVPPGEEHKPRWNISEDDIAVSDPLYIDAEELDVDAYDEFRDAQDSGDIDPDEPFFITIAPDVHHKSNYSGGDGLELALPNPAADLPLQNAEQDFTFVSYLRNVFQWGGFPGLADYPRRDEEVLAALKQDLLPI